MNLSKIPKSLYLVLVILMVTIGVIVFIEKKAPADNKVGISTTTNPPSSTNTQPTSEIDTSNWKTYINKNWGYELKYPQDWYVDEGPDAVAIDILAYGVETKPYIKDVSRRIGITVFKNQEEVPKPFFPAATVQTTKITVGGVKADEYLLTEVGGKRRVSKWVFIEKGGRFYLFVVSMENHQTVEIFNQMLTTFVFIE